MKKLIPALVLLLVSAMVMSTASYAWFSMNRTVSATGMSLTSTAPANLLIDNNDGTESWGATIASNESYTGKLYPASTTTGLEFFAIKDGQALSNGIGGIVSDSVNTTTKFNSSVDNSDIVKAMSGAASGYWAEYVLKFKTTGESSLSVYLDQITFADNLSYSRVADPDVANIGDYYERGGSAPNYTYAKTTDVAIDVAKTYYTEASIYTPVTSPDVNKLGSYYEENAGVYTLTTDVELDAEPHYYTISSIESCVRVGLFNQDGTLIGIYAVDNGTTVDPVKDITADANLTAVLNGLDVKKLLTTDAVKQATVFTVAGNEVVKTITVKVWIEGQNPNCINNIAGQDFSIGLTFKTVTANS